MKKLTYDLKNEVQEISQQMSQLGGAIGKEREDKNI